MSEKDILAQIERLNREIELLTKQKERSDAEIVHLKDRLGQEQATVSRMCDETVVKGQEISRLNEEIESIRRLTVRYELIIDKWLKDY